VPRPRGRPCRRPTIGWARVSSQVATARAPAPSCKCEAGSASASATVTASRALHLRSHATARMSKTASCARSGRKSRSAPPSRRPARRFLLRHHRACVPPAGRTRARLHPRKRQRRKTLPCRGASLASAFRGESGGQLVLASAAAAWSLHPGKRRRQLTVASATIVLNASPRAPRRRHRAAIEAGPVGTPRPPFPPPRPSPLDPPTWAPIGANHLTASGPGVQAACQADGVAA